MLGSCLQTMGSASRFIKIMILVCFGILLWRLWFFVFPALIPSKPPQVQVIQSGTNSHQEFSTERLEVLVRPPLSLAVYYEALCPDSRDFLVRQLKPAVEEFGEAIDVQLIPYGKATTEYLKDGSKRFRCQHGPAECQANMVHACVVKHITKKSTKYTDKDNFKVNALAVSAAACMIKRNSHKSDPINDAQKCLRLLGISDDVMASVSTCVSGEQGKDLLVHMGKMTHDLRPEPSFIPTVSINQSLERQGLILRDLKRALCQADSGSPIASCHQRRKKFARQV